VGENSTVERTPRGKSSSVMWNSTNIFEVSRRDKSQFDVAKDKRTKNNNLEFLIG
jgi:hypothetical protein